MTAPTRTITIEDLHNAINTMIETTRVRLHREDTGKVEWQTIPSLWTQLEDSVSWTGGGSSGGGAYRTRPTIATGVVSLMIEIATAATEGAMTFGDNRKTVPGNLRAIAASLPNWVSDRREDRIIWWTESIRKWVHAMKIELRIEPDLPRNLRGTRCPDCGASTITTGEGDDKVRSTALTIVWATPQGDGHKADTDWTVRAIECRVCEAAWFRGDSMNTLMATMLAKHTAA